MEESRGPKADCLCNSALCCLISLKSKQLQMKKQTFIFYTSPTIPHPVASLQHFDEEQANCRCSSYFFFFLKTSCITHLKYKCHCMCSEVCLKRKYDAYHNNKTEVSRQGSTLQIQKQKLDKIQAHDNAKVHLLQKPTSKAQQRTDLTPCCMFIFSKKSSATSSLDRICLRSSACYGISVKSVINYGIC